MAGGLKVLHVSAFDIGGAAKSCIRLHRSLQGLGFDSRLMVRYRFSSENDLLVFKERRSVSNLIRARFRQLASRVPLINPALLDIELEQSRIKARLPKEIEFFSFPQTYCDITETTAYGEADVVHLHWVAGFLDYQSFFKRNTKPVVWTIHDMEPFQGGNHYKDNFFGIEDSGKPKPFTFPESVLELVHRNVAIKTEALSSLKNLVIAAPSLWLRKASQESELLGCYRHYHIPYGLDSDVFRPRNKRYSKEFFGLPLDKPCFLFVSDKIDTNRKGLEFARLAIQAMADREFCLCAVGSVNPDKGWNDIICVGRIEDERLMSILYSAADAFIIPSIEDNLPNTVIESLMCGTPVIGFPTGGIPDMIQDGFNGYLCPDISVQSLRLILDKFLSSPVQFNTEAIRSDAVARFDQRVQAEAYVSLYNEILNR